MNQAHGLIATVDTVAEKEEKYPQAMRIPTIKRTIERVMSIILIIRFGLIIEENTDTLEPAINNPTVIESIIFSYESFHSVEWFVRIIPHRLNERSTQCMSHAQKHNGTM